MQTKKKVLFLGLKDTIKAISLVLRFAVGRMIIQLTYKSAHVPQKCHCHYW